jgi:tRNA 2-thiouridine synthesizing protein C
MDFTISVVIRQAPYGTVMPAEAYRTIQALLTFEREVSVLFIEDGVITMVKDSDPEPIGMQSLADAYVGLLAMDGVTMAVHAESLNERGLTVNDLVVLPGGADYELITTDKLEDQMSGHKAVICF